MKKILCCFAILLFALVSCKTRQVTTAGRLVGADRDPRGCIRSAGYTWSNALHSCVRIWDAGVRLERERETIFVIFSKDSLYGELTDGTPVERPLCRRVKGTDVWRNVKTRDQVLFKDDRICATVCDSVTYYSENCIDYIRQLQDKRWSENDSIVQPENKQGGAK